MITQTYDLNLIPGGVPVHVRASQYDAGTRTVVFRLFSGSLVFTPASGTVARVEGTRADGVAFTASADIDGSTVSFTVTSAMTNAAGAHAAEIVFTDGSGNPLGTKNFIIDVEAAAMDESAEPTEEEESLYQEYYKKIRADTAAAASSASAAAASAQSAAASAEEAAETVSNMAALTASGSGDIVTLHNLAGGIPLKELTVHIEPVQAGSGDPSPDNVRPITGWTGAKVTVSPTRDARDGTSYDISFGSAGTVYGGTLDVTTGGMVVNRAMVTFDGSETWGTANISQKSKDMGLIRLWTPVDRLSVDLAPTMSSQLPTYADTSWLVDQQASLRFEVADRYEVAVYTSNFADVTAWKSYLKEKPMQVVYSLANPITYQLTPQEVRSLLGVNNIWADTGPVDVTYRADVSAMQARINELSAAMDGTYTGVDLTVRFASEIANYSSVWAWNQARAKAKNYADLHVGDYIPIKTTNNITLNAQIAGLGNYTGYGDSAVGGHIDFICKELWPTRHVMNKVNFNNGISDAAPYPWLASDLYHYLNSLSGTVPNAAAVGGGDGEAVDYTADGVYYYLPAALKAVIIQKRLLLPKRYSASGLLSADNGWGWADAGLLWIPSEIEVYGTAMWGNTDYGAGGFQQYPLFAHNMNRVKYRSGSRDYWWLLSAASGNSTYFARVNTGGAASTANASDTYIAAPVCFRVG